MARPSATLHARRGRFSGVNSGHDHFSATCNYGGGTFAAAFPSGENLMGAANAPVRLSNQRRLVYSPHSCDGHLSLVWTMQLGESKVKVKVHVEHLLYRYGPSVYMHDYMRDRNFPSNLEEIFDEHFGFVAGRTGQPVVVGEMGGTFLGLDRVWQEESISSRQRPLCTYRTRAAA